MRELYVYYRVAADAAEHCERIVRGFQDGLRQAEPRLVARLLARPEMKDGEQTWMETYALAVAGSPGAGTGSPADPGIDAVLEARIAAVAQALAPHLRSPRHVEAFIAKR